MDFEVVASTLPNEQGWIRDAIERQLAHGERDEVRAAYNYAQHLSERRKMMQAWADYLVRLKEGAVSSWASPPGNISTLRWLRASANVILLKRAG